MNEQERKAEAAWKEMLEQRSKERDQAIGQAKTALFGYLAEHHPQIARIEVHYDGCGDEGFVGDVFYYTTLDDDDKHVEFKDEEMDKLIEELFIHVTPDGFENNEGGDGEIDVCPATHNVTVFHNQNVLEQESETYEV